jgi:hypothetical protein
VLDFLLWMLKLVQMVSHSWIVRSFYAHLMLTLYNEAERGYLAAIVLWEANKSPSSLVFFEECL